MAWDIQLLAGEKKKKSSLCCFVFSLKCDLEEIVSVNWRTTAKLGERHCTIARALREGGSNDPPASRLVLGEGVAERFSNVNLLRLTLKGGGRIHRRWKIPSCVFPESSGLSVVMVEANKKPDM